MKKLLWALVVLLFLYSILNLFVYVFQEDFVFLERRLDTAYNFSYEGEVQEVNIPIASTDRTINALHFKADTSHAKGVVLYFHGNSFNLLRWAKFADDFTQHQWDVIMIDYPGYGKSPGNPSEEGFYQAADATFTYAKNKYPLMPIISYGRSLGTPVAAYISSEYEVDQVILEAPLYSMEDVFRYRLPRIFYPFDLSTEFPTYKFIELTEEPVNIFHGTMDGVVPYDSGKRLAKYLKDPDDFITLEGGGHNGLRGFPEYQERLATLLK